MSFVIITYHSLDESGSPVSIRPRDFEAHLRHLHRRGFVGVSLREAVERLRHGTPPPRRTLVITFDDGYRNNLTVAEPILRRYGFPATVFVLTGYVGSSNRWPDQHRAIPELPMMDWSEVRALRDAGIAIGAHTHTHRPLTELSPAAARSEMARSKAELEERLGEPVELFSYPYGSQNPAVREIARDLFVAAVGNVPGRVEADADPHALDRVNGNSPLFRRLPLRLLASADFGVYLAAKRGLDAVRSLAGLRARSGPRPTIRSRRPS